MEPKKSISIGNKSYFSTFIGKRVLRKDLEKIKDSQTATIPLYSANVHRPFGCVESSNISDFSSDSILWGIDGDFDFSIQSAGNIFATTDHCGCIKILDINIDSKYLLYILRIAKTLYNFDRSLRSNLENMSKIEISIPIKKNGEFDLEKQREIAKKYEKLEKIKDRIRIMKENLESQVIEFGESIEGEEISISEKFDLFSGDKVRKIQNHQGKYPIIGSQTKNNGIIASTNTPFFKDCSPNNLYVTFGDHTRYFQIRSMPFSNTDAVKVLKLKNAFQDKFDLSYLLYTWRKLIPNQGYARHWSVAKRITIKVPTRPDGSFNLEKQKEIAHKYEKIEKMKSDLIQELEYLESVKVEI